MLKKSGFGFGAALRVVFFASVAMAGGHGHKGPMKKGILLVRFDMP
ncbi:MAG: hypothetical protein JJV98_13920 [Desulfosarcina sp.]|nr:hypothetical protein [Desulfobacterales bacterium]